MTSCAACCASRYQVKAGLEPATNFVLHSFPTSPALCQVWLEFCGYSDINEFTPTQLKSKRLCSRHFLPESYMGPNSKRLRPDAVPINGPHEMQHRDLVSTMPTTDVSRSAMATTEGKTFSSDGIADNAIQSANCVTGQLESVDHTCVNLGSVKHVNTVSDTSQFNAISIHSSPHCLKTKTSPVMRKITSRRNIISQIRTYCSSEMKPQKRFLSKRSATQHIIVKYLWYKCKQMCLAVKQSNRCDSALLNAIKYVSLSQNSPKLVLSASRNAYKFSGRKYWSESDKAFCLLLLKHSPTCYKLMQKVMKLPSCRTLSHALNSVPFHVGISDDVFKHLSESVKNMKPTERICSLMFDEMPLSEGFFYNESLDKIEGFEDYGHLGRTIKYANHALVFMIRGILHRWKQPVVYYFSHDKTPCARLKLLIKSVISELQNIGFCIVATICNQSITNVKAILQLCQETNMGRVKPYFDVGGEQIVTVFDPPHLLKTTRNYLQCYNCYLEPGKIAKWDYLKKLLAIEMKRTYSPLHKLTMQHVEPQGYLSKRVSLAAQVFSYSVAASLSINASLTCHHCQTAPIETDAMHLATFCDTMNKLFDSFNGRHNEEFHRWFSKHSGHCQFWHKLVKTISLWKFLDKNGKFVKTRVFEGWIHNTRAAETLLHLLSQKKIKRVWLRNLNQDCLENLFSSIRQYGDQDVDPTASQFISALKVNILSGMINVHGKENGNCLDDKTEILLNLRSFFNSEGLQVSKPTFDSYECFLSASSESDLENTALPLHHLTNLHPGVLHKHKTTAPHTACHILKSILPKHSCPKCTSTLVEYKHCPRNAPLNTSDVPVVVWPCSLLISKIVEVSPILLHKLGQMANHNNLLEKLSKIILTDFQWAGIGCDKHSSVMQGDVVKSLCIIKFHEFCKHLNRSVPHKQIKCSLSKKYWRRQSKKRILKISHSTI